MFTVYGFITYLVQGLLGLVSLFNAKLSIWTKGRKQTWKVIKDLHKQDRKTVWLHVASLGEYEQALPILQALKRHATPPYILVSFFSPSGYEVVKNKALAHAVCYLPLDTLANAKRFLSHLNPDVALFVKYELWPNYLKALRLRGVPHFLIAARFYKGQTLFNYSFGRNLLASFEAILCQDPQSMALAQQMAPDTSVSLVGDTRFDRVYQLAEQLQPIERIENFVNHRFCLVVGSSWPEEDRLIVHYLKEYLHDDFCVIIAPHRPSKSHAEALRNMLNEPVALWSENELPPSRVLIIDHIGLLNQVYQSATIALVGGGFKTGLHNTLEPAALGIPVLIGPQYDSFPEVVELIKQGGLLVVHDYETFEEALSNFHKQPRLISEMGALNKKGITEYLGATQRVMEAIEKYL
jgi:3-deoxy-D-manno-octulosonic-acid transferase